MANGIVVENLTKTYRRGLLGEPVHALNGVSLAIAPGEMFGIIGPNGAGKTTLLGCLLGFLRPDGGRVAIDGHDPDDLAVRAVTGYLPERLVLDRWMNGFEFLAYHHALARLPQVGRREACAQALARVGLDGAAGQRRIRAYSRGMLQRLGLAQALLGVPRYVFLDEPASGVDPAGVVLFRKLLGDLKGSGVTVVLNSHQLEQVERVCDRVAFVKDGRVEAIETLEAGAAHARGIRVRWAALGAPPVQVTLRAAAERAGASYVEMTAAPSGGGTARFAAADDAGAVRLLRALIEAGVPVLEASPEESRLERLFLTPGDGTVVRAPDAGVPVPAAAVPVPPTPATHEEAAPASDPARFMPPDRQGGGS
jgi:ABC-type multidrug transport system ATPase subunit